MCSKPICCARILSNRLLNAPMYSATEGRRQTLPVFVFLYEVSCGCRVSTSAGICDGSIQEAWSHDCPVGLSFRGLFPNPRKPIEPISSALRAREFDKAVELSRSALRESPNNAQLWTLQGIAFASKGDSKEALAAFQQALNISPNSIAALAGAAQIEYQAGNRDAVPLLNRLLQLRPGDPTGHAMLAVLEYRQGNCAAATPHFEKAGELLDSQLD